MTWFTSKGRTWVSSRWMKRRRFFLKRNALVIEAWHAHSLDYSITFLQHPAAYIYFDDACLVCAQACGEHRNAASYFLEAHLVSLSRCCRMQHVTLYCILIVCKLCTRIILSDSWIHIDIFSLPTQIVKHILT